MHHCKIPLILVFCYCTLMAGAQTVTVSKDGASDYTTIQAAVDSFVGDMDPAPNRIEIIDSAVYEEVFYINVPVTIEGTAPSRPILAVKAHPSFPYEGVLVYNQYPSTTTTNSTILRNLIVIPALESPPDDAMVADGYNFYFELDNVLITANNGSNAPVSLDGLTRADTTGAVHFGDDGLRMGGGENFTGVLKNTVITHMESPTGIRQDGLELVGGHHKILDGCVFSFCKRLGILGNGAFEIDAPTTKCLIINNGGFAGIWFEDGGQRRRINGAIIANNAGFGIEHQNGMGTQLTISNSILANNLNDNLRVSEVGTNGDITLTNVTLGKAGNPGVSPMDVDSGSAANILLIDCIVAGNGSTDGSNTLLHNGTGTLNLSGTSLVLDGPLSLTSATGGTGQITGTPTTTADPQFINTTDPTSPDYYDVANPAYASANSTGGPLAGGADYIGGSSVSDWSVY